MQENPSKKFDCLKKVNAVKKGDIKKHDFLLTAEDLFCRNGYEKTSVQDIIDCLHSSKGSFYHHFPSKESLLEGICGNRAEQIYVKASAEAEKADSTIQKLDILLTGTIPFQEEKLRFLLMLIPVFSLPEGRIVRQYYCDALATIFHDPISVQIKAGQNCYELRCDDPDIAATLILHVVNRMWVQITDMIIETELRHKEPELSEYLHLTDCCRNLIERFLSIPYGSINLINLPSLRFLIEQIHNHWE